MAGLPAPSQQLHDDFLTYERVVAGRAPATLRHRSRIVVGFLTWLHANRPALTPAQVGVADLTDYLIHEADRGIAAATRRQYLACLRRFYAWLLRTGQGTTDPTVLLETPRANPAPIIPYKPEEVAAILAHTETLTDLRGRLRDLIVQVLRYTGMRQGELRTMRLDDVDLAAGIAHVVGKGERRRPVVLPAPLLPVIKSYVVDVRPELPESPLLLVNPHVLVTTPHRGFGSEAVYGEVERAGRDAGIPGRHFPHRWRHTFATELLREGVELHHVQRLLGHRSVVSTTLYTHLEVGDLQAATDGLWT